LTVVPLDPATTCFECLTLRICGVRFRIFGKFDLLRRRGLAPTLPLAGFFLFLLTLADLLGLVVLALLFFSVESLLGLS
jgi:hypothetical protein